MNAKRYAVIVFSLLTVVAATVAWRHARAVGTVEAACTMVAPKRTRTVAECRQMAERLAQADQRQAELTSALAILQKPTAQAKKVAPLRPEITAEEQKFHEAWIKFEQRQRDPVIQNLRLASMRLSFASQYALLIRHLGLAPAEREQFLDACMKYQEVFVDLNDLVKEQGWSMRDPAVAAVMTKARADAIDAWRVLLGPERLKQMNEYELGGRQRNLVQRMAGEAAAAGTPFTTQQAERLVQVFTVADRDYRAGESASALNIDWAAADDQIRALLSAEQFAVYQTSKTRFTYQFYAIMRQALAADTVAKAAAAAATPAKPGS